MLNREPTIENSEEVTRIAWSAETERMEVGAEREKLICLGEQRSHPW